MIALSTETTVFSVLSVSYDLGLSYYIFQIRLSQFCIILFAGNVLNGTIGKQMVDTLVESSANVEVRFKYLLSTTFVIIY